MSFRSQQLQQQQQQQNTRHGAKQTMMFYKNMAGNLLSFYIARTARGAHIKRPYIRNWFLS
jgi:hypothetical protein